MGGGGLCLSVLGVFVLGYGHFVVMETRAVVWNRLYTLCACLHVCMYMYAYVHVCLCPQAVHVHLHVGMQTVLIRELN